MNWNIAVVDDLQMDRERLQADLKDLLAKEEKEVNISVFDNAKALLASFEKTEYNLVFLDIVMDGMTGIELSKLLRADDSKLLIVFITSSKEFAFDAFPVHPFDYLIKPYKKERLERLLGEVRRTLAGKEPEILVKAPRAEYKIPFSHIVSVTSQGHGVEFHLKDGTDLRSMLSFGIVEERLCADKRFLLCNRGVLVNMDMVVSMDGESFRMSDGSSYSLRTKGRMELIQKFSQYQISRMRRGML